MVTDTGPLSKGLAKARAELEAFAKLTQKIATGDPIRNIARGFDLIGAGIMAAIPALKQFGVGIATLAYGATAFLDPFVDLGKAIAATIAGSGFVKNLSTHIVGGFKAIAGPIALGAQAILAPVLAKAIGGKALLQNFSKQVIGGLSAFAGPIAVGFKALFGQVAIGSKVLFGPIADTAKVALKPIMSGLAMMPDVAKKAGQGLALVGAGLANIAGRAAVGGLKAVAAGINLVAAAAAKSVSVIRQAVNQLGLFAAIAGTIAVAAITSFVKKAADLEAQQARISRTFGESGEAMKKQAENLSIGFGISEKEALKMQGTLGLLFADLGYGEKQTAALSQEFTKLSAGLMANNPGVQFEEVATAIQKATTGSFRGLKALGIAMTEDEVKAYAYRKGIAGVTAELTDAQKTQAAISLLQEKLAGQQGALAGTTGLAGRSFEQLAAAIEKVQEILGQAFLPLLVPIVQDLTTGIRGVAESFGLLGNKALDASSQTVEGAAQQVMSIGFVQKAVSFVVDAWQAVKLGFIVVQSYVTAGIAHLVGALAKLADAISWVGEQFGHAKLGAGEFLKGVQDDLNKLAGDQWKKFEMELAKPPASEEIGQFFDNAKAKIEGARKAVADLKTDASKFTPKPQYQMQHEIKFASAMEKGSQEAANTILRSRFGGGMSNKDLAKIQDNTRKSAESLEKMVASQAVLGIISNL